MAYDKKLAARVREVLTTEEDIRELKMFGGLAFMMRGNMCCGILGDRLMLRLGNDAVDALVGHPGVGPMDFTGRIIRSMVLVSQSELKGKQKLNRWVAKSMQFAATLPPK